MNFAQSIAKPQDGAETPLRSVQIDGQVSGARGVTMKDPSLINILAGELHFRWRKSSASPSLIHACYPPRGTFDGLPLTHSTPPLHPHLAAKTPTSTLSLCATSRW